MSDEIKQNDEEMYIAGTPVQPQKYNIVLTREGEEIDFDFPAPDSDLITTFGYIIPTDERCESQVVPDEDVLYDILSPVLGTSFEGELAYQTRKQVVISLHDIAILGYQRQVIIDPRISNEVAIFWEMFLDRRIFSQAEEIEWQEMMAEIIITELEDGDADMKLAEDIKTKLLEQVASE